MYFLHHFLITGPDVANAHNYSTHLQCNNTHSNRNVFFFKSNQLIQIVVYFDRISAYFSSIYIAIALIIYLCLWLLSLYKYNQPIKEITDEAKINILLFWDNYSNCFDSV